MLNDVHPEQELTQEDGEPGRLVVVDDGHAHGVERHQAQHGPVEGVGLHHAADGDTQETLLPVEVRRGAALGAPDAGSGHGDTWGGEGEREGERERERERQRERE